MKPGRIYVMAGAGRVKVGFSVDPDKRAETVARSAGELAVVFVTDLFADAYAVERAVHRALSEWRLEGEWFAVSPEAAIAQIELAVAQLSPQPTVYVSKVVPPFSMRMDADLKAKLQSLAAEDRRSLTNYVEAKLWEIVEASKEKALQ